MLFYQVLAVLLAYLLAQEDGQLLSLNTFALFSNAIQRLNCFSKLHFFFF